MIRNRFRSFTILIVGAALLLGSTMTAAASGKLTDVRGSVEVGRGIPIGWQIAHAGDALRPGDILRTGAQGRAELEVDGSTIRLYENSLLRLPGTARPGANPNQSIADSAASSTIRLDKGRSLFDILRRRDGATLEVTTPEIVVSVKGTRFSVDAALHAVAVFRGEVGVRGLSNSTIEEILVREGFSIARFEGGLLELHANPARDPWSGWSAGTAFPATLHEGAMQAPAARALEQAMQAARAQAKPNAIKTAIERSPRLRHRVSEIVAEQASKSETKVRRGHQSDGSPDKHDRAINEKFPEASVPIVANGNLSGFTYTDLGSSGPGGGHNILVEKSTSGLSVVIPEAQLINVIQNGANFSAPIQSLLSMQGVSEEAFAQLLLAILNAN